MEIIEGSKGVLRPIWVLSGTLTHEQLLHICWYIDSNKFLIALLAELLRRQSKQLSSDVTAEEMTELLVKQRKKTQRGQLWRYKLEDFDETDAKHFLKMAREVNTNLKMREVEFEARRLPHSPETMPPQFGHPIIIISQPEECARGLRDQLQQNTVSELLGTRGVAMAVVQKVLRGFWLLPQDRVSAAQSSTLLQLIISHSIRDNVVPSDQENERQVYTEDVLVEKLICLAAELLNTMADVATGEICTHFQPQNHTEADSPALSPPLIPSPAIIAVQDGPTSSQTEPNSLFAPLVPITTDPNFCDVFDTPAGQPTSDLNPATAVTSAPLRSAAFPDDEAPPPQPSSETDKAVILSPNLPPSILHGEDVCDILIKVVSAPLAHYSIFDEPAVITKQDDFADIQNESKTKPGIGLYGFLNWLFCCCVLPEDDYLY